MKRKVKLTKQYGIVNKRVLQNKNISANAKGLYVYLCARAGNKKVCIPTIATICNDLNINVATFHKLKKELINNQIIEIKKNGVGIKKHNIYYILNQNQKGYGFVFLDILKDKKISLKAKAIYGLISCFAGARFIAYPLAKIVYTYLNMSRNTYFKAIGKLKENKYIQTKQLHINGRFAYCNYYINESTPNNKNTKFIFKCNRKNKKASNKKTSNKDTFDKNTSLTTNTEYSRYKNIVIDTIEYNVLCSKYANNKKAIYILEHILDILINAQYKTDDIKINGNIINKQIVKSILGKLNFNHIKLVVNNILEVTEKINNLNQYIKVALVNSYYQLERINYNTMKGF